MMLEVGPVALVFEAEHPVGGLPAIADLSTDHRAARLMAAFNEAMPTFAGEVPTDKLMGINDFSGRAYL